LFPKVKLAILYVGQDEILGAYNREKNVILLNPFRDDVTYPKFFVTWIHETVHWLLRHLPTLDNVFEQAHYRFHIL